MVDKNNNVSYKDLIIKNKDFVKLGAGKSVDEIPYEKDRPAVVTRTGGTTGVSKGVLLTNDSLNAVYANFRDVVGTGKGNKFLNFLPVETVFNSLIPISLLIGIGIGFFGSFITVRKHLHV